LRELVFFPLWNRSMVSKLHKQGYDVVFYQCSTALLLIRRTPFHKVLYTRALLLRRLKIYVGLELPIHTKMIIKLLLPFVYVAERFSFRHADRIVASKQRFVVYLQQQFGLDSNKFKVAPQMIDLPIRQLRSSKKYDLLFIGRLTPPKNWQLVVDIAKMSNYKIAAATPEMQTPDNVPNNITIFHRVPYSELAKLISQSKIFIMPSHNEEGPRVTLEAMACGLPVVASLEGGGGFVEDGVNGFVIQANEPALYIEAISRTLGNKTLMGKMSRLNKAKALEFTPEYQVKKYIDALQF